MCCTIQVLSRDEARAGIRLASLRCDRLINSGSPSSEEVTNTDSDSSYIPSVVSDVNNTSDSEVIIYGSEDYESTYNFTVSQTAADLYGSDDEPVAKAPLAGRREGRCKNPISH